MGNSNFRGIFLLIMFVWAGMLLGISFLEAPLKFHAPNVTLAIGVGIGRLVFGTLNKIELFFGFILIFLFFDKSLPRKILYPLGIVLLILLIQSVWLLPALDARATTIIAGGVPAEKSPHIYYVAGEALKLISLISMGLMYFSESIRISQKA